MTYTITHMLGHIHATYTNSTQAHEAVLKLIPLGTAKSTKLLNSLNHSKAGSTIRAEYDGCEVSILLS